MAAGVARAGAGSRSQLGPVENGDGPPVIVGEVELGRDYAPICWAAPARRRSVNSDPAGIGEPVVDAEAGDVDVDVAERICEVASQFLRSETVMTKGMAAEVRNEPENWSSCRR